MWLDALYKAHLRVPRPSSRPGWTDKLSRFAQSCNGPGSAVLRWVSIRYARPFHKLEEAKSGKYWRDRKLEIQEPWSNVHRGEHGLVE